MNLAKRKPDGSPPRLLVLGDLMLDRYTWGDAERVSPEAPVVILRADETERQLGGAASVARLAAGLEADVTIVGLVGRDGEGDEVVDLLREASVNAEGVVRSERPTTVKHRFVGRAAGRHAHQMLRVDREDRSRLPQSVEDEIIERLTALLATADALVVSDYAKGVCSERVLRRGIYAARSRGIPVTVDPARLRDSIRYSGSSILTPNRSEAEALTGVRVATVGDAEAAGFRLLHEAKVDAAAVTLDRDGMLLVEKDRGSRHFPAIPREVYDITGAGDMVLAALSYGLALGWNLGESVEFANLAAGLEVERQGIAPIRWEEIEAAENQLSRTSESRKILARDRLLSEVAAARRRGERIAFTNGCFDLLHAGHIATLQHAAKLGDRLVVAINSDDSLRRLKGPDRPLVRQDQRAEALAALACVAHVLVYDEDTPCELLENLRPDVLVKGGTTERVVGREIVESYGGCVVTAPEVVGVSTTSLIDRFRGSSVRQEATPCT